MLMGKSMGRGGWRAFHLVFWIGSVAAAQTGADPLAPAEPASAVPPPAEPPVTEAPASEPAPAEQPATSSLETPALVQAAECMPACRSGYLCHEGACVSACNPACAEGETCTTSGECRAPVDYEATSSSSDAKPKAPTGVNLHVNALGPLQFGLIPRLEIGGSTTVLLGAHFFNSGLLSYVVLQDPSDDEYFDFGIGANFGLRHYFNAGGGQAGFYLGAFVEYAFTRVIDDVDDRAAYQRHSIVPAVDIGYRWVWGKFLLDVGVLAGAAVGVAAEDVPINPGGCGFVDSCLGELNTTAFGMGVVDVGFFF